ncbi:hypothetical protein RRF57_012678 [Xylaria bambusicola]|uniref:Uncharacterized protein n=1 Tax=Xylaria bambusicola TaxID=326684 RepID=A0AAN7ZDU7_9PEZI
MGISTSGGIRGINDTSAASTSVAQLTGFSRKVNGRRWATRQPTVGFPCFPCFLASGGKGQQAFQDNHGGHLHRKRRKDGRLSICRFSNGSDSPAPKGESESTCRWPDKHHVRRLVVTAEP